MRWLSGLVLGVVTAAQASPAARPPNVVIVLCDDLGYGDVGAYGHPTARPYVASRHPEVIASLRAIAAAHARTVQPVENQITKRLPPYEPLRYAATSCSPQGGHTVLRGDLTASTEGRRHSCSAVRPVQFQRRHSSS